MKENPFEGRHIMIIAEAGVNHNGSLDMAFKLIHAAKEAGADYVKFQTAKPSSLVSTFAQKAEYQKATTGADESQLDMLKRLLLPFEDFVALKEECEKVGIGFMSTPFDLDSLDFLCRLRQDFIKIPSGEITNLPLLREISKRSIPVIMSTGMATVDEVDTALKILIGKHPLHTSSSLSKNDICLLHCTTMYPTPYHDVNLRAMHLLGEEFGVATGYSDHTQGIEVPVAAAALGAKVIEKHFTLSRSLPGPDHKASLEPDELAEMVRSIRHIEEALGSAVKMPTESERPNIAVARKSIVAARPIAKGEILSEENITTKRPGSGLSPMHWDEVLGTTALKDFEADELIII